MCTKKSCLKPLHSTVFFLFLFCNSYKRDKKRIFSSNLGNVNDPSILYYPGRVININHPIKSGFFLHFQQNLIIGLNHVLMRVKWNIIVRATQKVGTIRHVHV